MRILRRMLLALALVGAPAQAAVQVFACEPEWAALADVLGGPAVRVFTATTAAQDPHAIQARPSLIAAVRRADLIVCTGAELEVGWLPLLLRQAGNARVQPGRPGYFEAAAVVPRLEVPERVDRSLGDVHAAGNPHVHLDPHRLATIAAALAERLARIDAGQAAHYRERHAAFARRWQQAIAEWERRAAPLAGLRLVSHHRSWVYLYHWLNITEVGTLEPKPGIPASPGHLARLKQRLGQGGAHAIVRAPYNDARPSQWLAAETGIPAVVLPYTVGGERAVADLFDLFEVTLQRLLELRA